MLAAAALATLGLGAMPSGVAAAWDGSMDLYRSGVFSTQMTWRWCTAADVQIIRNIVRDTTNHSRDQPGAVLPLHARPQPLRHPAL